MEAFEVFCIADQTDGHHFDRHAASERFMNGFEHDSHAATANLTDDSILA